MCGLAGIISKTQRSFDYSTFCTLGIANDERGGDSCGIFIDGNVEYGTGKNKLFENFFLTSKLLEDTRRSTIALLHCRKASVGTISESTAQPVVLKDEGGKVQFVVIHNGTIYNYEDLAKKYIPEVNIKDMSDSQVMAHIFYYTGYDVLNEYNGGSVFVIVDYRGTSPKTLLFKGASKENKFDKEAKEERPLFYCINRTKRELVFSSIASYLLAVRRDEDSFIMNSNILFEFTGTHLAKVAEYSRENCTQKKELPIYTAKNYYKHDIKYYDDYFDSDDISFYAAFNYCSKFVSINLEKNLYTVCGKKCHGRLYLGEYGYIYDKLDKKYNIFEVWFFNGIPLLNMRCFRFLTVLKKESGLNDKEFDSKFQNVIRYLSLDRVYPFEGFWYKAISPIDKILFTGSYQPITAQSTASFLAGVKESSCYKPTRKNIIGKLSQKPVLNFKSIKEECMSLMK